MEMTKESLRMWRSIADPAGYSIRARDTKTGKWVYRPVNEPLTDDELAAHLKRKDDCRAIWLNVGTEAAPDAREHTRLMVFDFDDHNHRLEMDAIIARARDVGRVLVENSIPVHGFISGSGHGVHLWVTFATPKRVDQMKELADVILKKAGLARKAGGELADGFVEVLPKGIGQQVCALPFGRQIGRAHV